MEWNHERCLVSGPYVILRATWTLPSGRTVPRFRLVRDGRHVCYAPTVKAAKRAAEWDARP